MTTYSDDEVQRVVVAEQFRDGRIEVLTKPLPVSEAKWEADKLAKLSRDGIIGLWTERALSSFTRVVEETGVLDQGRSQKEKSR